MLDGIIHLPHQTLCVIDLLAYLIDSLLYNFANQRARCVAIVGHRQDDLNISQAKPELFGREDKAQA